MTTQHYVVACTPVGVSPDNEVTSNTVCHATVSRTRKDVSSVQTSDIEFRRSEKRRESRSWLSIT